MTSRVLIAAHKPYWVPSDGLYLPVQAGAASADSRIAQYVHDDEGDSISGLNGRYSELTVLWWGWRNLEEDALGLVHYRRHFAGGGERGTLTGDEARELMLKVPVVVARRRNYVIETIASHYAHTHDPRHLQALREGVRSVTPAMLDVFDGQMQARSAHMFNMLLMRREVLDPYCTWLFDVLGQTERHIDFAGMTAFQQRCVGRLGELLLDVWLAAHDVPYAELRVRELEGQNLVKRGASFLAAKFLGKSYDKSF